MNLTLIRSMTRSAVFELENELCYRPAHPFTVALNGKTVYEACNTNVFSLFSLLPGTTYTVEVQAEGETLKLDFTTEAETFFVDAARYGLVADGETDNTVRLQAALSTCPKVDTSRPLGNGHQLAYSLEYQCNCFPTQKLSYSVLPLCRQ